MHSKKRRTAPRPAFVVAGTLHRKLNTAEAAAYCDLGVSTLTKKRVFGGGPRFLKLGSRVVYDIGELDAWLDANNRSSTSDAGRPAA